MTAHAAWGDPVNHPWTTGAPQPTYSTEAILWGAFIEQHLGEFPADQKIKVAALVQNNDFGKLYDAVVQGVPGAVAELKDRVDYVSETIEAAGADGDRPDDHAGGEEPRRVDLDAGRHPVHPDRHRGRPERHEGRRPSTCSMPQTCPGATFIGKEKLGGDGSAGDGWWIVSPGIKDIKDPA